MPKPFKGRRSPRHSLKGSIPKRVERIRNPAQLERHLQWVLRAGVDLTHRPGERSTAARIQEMRRRVGYLKGLKAELPRNIKAADYAIMQAMLDRYLLRFKAFYNLPAVDAMAADLISSGKHLRAAHAMLRFARIGLNPAKIKVLSNNFRRAEQLFGELYYAVRDGAQQRHPMPHIPITTRWVQFLRAHAEFLEMAGRRQSARRRLEQALDASMLLRRPMLTEQIAKEVKRLRGGRSS